MNISKFEEVLNKGESINTEFKSWNKSSGMKERIGLSVGELIAFANSKGGTVYFGVEDAFQRRILKKAGEYFRQNQTEALL